MVSSKKPSFVFLFLLISFGSISAVAFSPALPAISHYFAVSDNQAGLVVTLFLIGFTFGQLLYGPLANRYGRKIALYMGIITEIIASLLCVFAGYLHLFWLLLAARLLMALGASVGLKMSFTLVNDNYDRLQATKMISHLMMAFAITPAFGVAIGGFLVQHINWHACFYFMALYGLFLLVLSFGIAETEQTLDLDALHFSKIITKYASALKNTQLLIPAILMGTGTAFPYIFATYAPFIGIQIIHLTPSQYGLWNLIPIIGIITGAQLSAYLSSKIAPLKIITLGIMVIIIGVIIMLFPFLHGDIYALFLFMPMILIYLGRALTYANASTLATGSLQDKSTASAAMSFINMSIPTLSVLLLSISHTISPLVLPGIYSLLILLAASMALVLKMS